MTLRCWREMSDATGLGRWDSEKPKHGSTKVAGVLEDLFDVRTNGNGYVLSEWDLVLLKRDLERLMAEGKVRELPSPVVARPECPDAPERRRFRDLDTGETYEYSGPWEKGRPRFIKLIQKDISQATS